MRLAGGAILVVEDNADLAENLAEILEDEGASVRIARSGAEAEAQARAPFDVALLDVRLPDASGLALLGELKHAGDGLAEIILVTGNAALEDAIEAVEGGAYAYILKPFAPDDLANSVERALRQARSSRQAAALARRLEQSEASLRTLVDTVQALLLVLDDEGRVVAANPAVAAVTGVAEADMLGRVWVDSFVPELEREAVRAVVERLRAGERGVLHETRIAAPGPDGAGAERWISWRSSPLTQEDGGVWIYASGLDVTELRLLQRRTQLAQRLAAVGTLTAGLAHEVRNPLNSATLQLRLLERRIERGGGDPALRGPLALVQEEIDRLSRLVNDFLGFARPVELQLDEVDLISVIEQVVDLETPAMTERDITLEVDAPGTPVRARIDGGRIKQVLLNLLRNAADAIGRDGRVKLTVGADEREVRLTVRDTGPGIPEALLGRIFEPFFSTKAQGTGLGMSISYSIIAQHGGDISVRPGSGGAEFEILLPRRPPPGDSLTDLPALRPADRR
jgi:PAS domain S-box-containing protein